MSETTKVDYYFPCPVYFDEKPEFLETVREVSEKYLEEAKQNGNFNELYPVHMTGNMLEDERLGEIKQYIGSSAWNILESQGYDMSKFLMTFVEFWVQEHQKFSSMDQHVHGLGSQIVGFYFIDVPEDAPRIVIHDPRAGKVQNDLPETDITNATMASKAINFIPKEGMLMLANSWLPHSFTRNASDEPFRFIHFNLAAMTAAVGVDTKSEVEEAEVV